MEYHNYLYDHVLPNEMVPLFGNWPIWVNAGNESNKEDVRSCQRTYMHTVHN